MHFGFICSFLNSSYKLHTSVTFVIIIPSTFQLRISNSVSLLPKYEEDSANPTTSLFVFCWTICIIFWWKFFTIVWHYFMCLSTLYFLLISEYWYFIAFLASLKLNSTFKKYCVYVNVSCLSALQSFSIQRFYCVFRT